MGLSEEDAESKHGKDSIEVCVGVSVYVCVCVLTPAPGQAWTLWGRGRGRCVSDRPSGGLIEVLSR